MTVSHASGDTLRRQHVHLVVSGAHCDGAPTEHPDGRYVIPASPSELAAGARGTLDSGNLCGGSGSLALTGAQVAVVWVGPEDVNSRTLMRWRGPSA